MLGKNKVCPHCKLPFTKLKEHMDSGSCLRCKRCNVNFGSKQELDTHQLTCDADEKASTLPKKFLP